jgi:hypothetical protein
MHTFVAVLFESGSYGSGVAVDHIIMLTFSFAVSLENEIILPSSFALMELLLGILPSVTVQTYL